MATQTFLTKREKDLRSINRSHAMKMRNYEKKVRLAVATKGDESIVHQKKANKFAKDYKIKPLPFKLK